MCIFTFCKGNNKKNILITIWCFFPCLVLTFRKWSKEEKTLYLQTFVKIYTECFFCSFVYIKSYEIKIFSRTLYHNKKTCRYWDKGKHLKKTKSVFEVPNIIKNLSLFNLKYIRICVSSDIPMCLQPYKLTKNINK